MDSHGLFWFLVFLAWVVGAGLYAVLKYGGLGPAALRARFERTLGEFDTGNGMRVKVHWLAGATPEKAIGVEFVQHAFPVVVVALSVSEARKLVTLLRSGVSDA